jgi:tetratricopeptide (TPR) repeat protein
MAARWRRAILLALLTLTVVWAWFIVSARNHDTRVSARSWANSERIAGLQPDRRFLVALSEMERIATGTSGPPTSASFDSTQWVIRRGTERLGAVSELPAYSELRALLEREANRVAAGLGRPDTSVHRPDASTVAAGRTGIDRELRDMHALRALQRADRLWASGVRDGALAIRAADALTLLMLQTVDQVGASDSLAGAALAMTALASALDSSAARRVECLLADRLDYGAAAWSMAQRLPNTDPRRWYVLRDDARLASGVSREARYLHLTRLAQRGDLEAWAPEAASFAGDHALDLPLLCSGLSLERFASNPSMGAMLIGCVARDLDMLTASRGVPADAAPGADLGGLMNRFEDLMAGMSPASDGPILHGAVVRAFYRACFYSGFRAVADHLLYSLASLPASEGLSASLGSAHPGPALEFSTWYSNLIRSRRGENVDAALRDDVKHLQHFGQPLVNSTVQELAEVSARGQNPGVGPVADLLAERLDSRPWARSTLAYALRFLEMDPARADAIDGSDAGTLSPREAAWRTWWAARDGDTRTLLAIAADSSLTSTERADALEKADQMCPAESVTIMMADERFAEALPTDFRAVDRYALACEHRGRFAQGREALQRWLTRENRSDQEFDEIFARTTIARMYQKEGHPEEGLAAVRPVIESQQFGAMQRAALIMQDLGRASDARDLAYRAWRRYPDSEGARALVVQLLWRAGDDALAAREWARGDVLLPTEEVRKALAPTLLALDRERPGAALKALAPVIAMGERMAFNLDRLAAIVSEMGHDSLAFEIQSRLKLPADNRYDGRVRAYQYLSRARGPKGAAAWMHDYAVGQPPISVMKLMFMAFGQGAYQLLWDLPMPALAGDTRENIWLLRAATVSGDSTIAAGRRGEVERHFATRGSSRYRVFGRYMLGLEGEKAVLSAASTHRALGEATYFLGLKAQQQGHIREAASWFARCIGLRERANAEDYWARWQIAQWRDTGHSIAWLERAAARSHGTGATRS